MWTVVYMAKGKKLAEKLNTLFTQEGVLAKIQPISKNAQDDEAYFEILVPEVEVEEAHNILYELGY